MRLAVIVMLDSDDEPNQVVGEVVSALEFDHRTTIKYAVVFTDDGEQVAVYDRKEKTQ
jgi:hypothetical protein